MTQYDIRPAELADTRAIASGMRPEDVAEVWASHHASPEEAVTQSFLVARATTFTALADGEPVCMFGVTPGTLLTGVSKPWMLGTTKLQFHSREFLRRSRELVALLREEFPLMRNYVHAENKAAIRWLQWVGFSVYYPEPYGAEGELFHRFEMRG